jgi:hypothetical protein
MMAKIVPVTVEEYKTALKKILPKLPDPYLGMLETTYLHPFSRCQLASGAYFSPVIRISS